LILFEVPASVLPILLLLMVVVPATLSLYIPYIFTAFVFGVFIVVIAPMILLRQSTVPVLLTMFIPYKDAVEAVASSTIEFVPEDAPIVLPVIVPTFTSPAFTLIPYQE
jgi:hypothetical protein